MGKLTPAEVLSAQPGRLADGDGLYLLTQPIRTKLGSAKATAKTVHTKTWVLRVQVDGKRRDIGLGTVDVARLGPKKTTPRIAIPVADLSILQRKLLTLAEARQKAEILRRAAKDGLNPVVERDRSRQEIPSFEKAAKNAHEALKSGWKEKGAKTFLSSLENHAFPTLGNVRVDQITAAQITTALAPIWTSKPDMARKVRQRIGTVLNFAHGKGWRTTEAPGKSVTVGLPRQPKGGNYKSMPFADVPAFMQELRSSAPTKGRRALMLHILTAARGGEVRRARWGQIDLDKCDWNRPEEIMKGVHAPAHTVTLNSPAIALLMEIKGASTPNPNDLIFPGERGAIMSDMTMNKVMRTANRPYDVHGFRSSFRDWAAETMPDVPDPVAEAAIAHIVPDKVVRAYKRTNFIEMRRKLLEAWGGYIMTNAIRAAINGN
ncbi:integrase [Sphingomonas glacialis]|uniref:Integrase n=1 Tax=Sphingomonas glacialis TaxID=658225 RepID=A0ABQ3LHX1_9SPHN|nr:site-specific integrase [Sphingomonas glacialis]GHH16051.1 integrase [Sphingomonas glacialis]